MDVNKINQAIGQAKNNLNSMKGQSDGLLSEAHTRFIGNVVNIIDGLVADIIRLESRNAELEKLVPKETKPKK